MIPTPQEEYMLKIWRELVPFEKIICTKDPTGKINNFLVERSQKIVVNEITIKTLIN